MTLSGEKKVEFGIKVVLFLIAAITLYPFIYVISMSLSNPVEAFKGNVYFLPKGFSLKAYGIVFNEKGIWRAYTNTIWYTVVGTLFNILLATITAYPLARKDFFLKKYYMIFILITMFFSGGLVPLFILINKLGLYNSRWAVVLPAAVNVTYIILVRAFILNLPNSYRESAYIDGANDLQVLYKIIIPLCKPIIAVIALFTGVAFWNSYFPALLYISDTTKQPVSLYMVKLVVKQSLSITNQFGTYERQLYGLQIQYAAMIIVMLPVMCVYPFLQKYFASGLMIGSLKG